MCSALVLWFLLAKNIKPDNWGKHVARKQRDAMRSIRVQGNARRDLDLEGVWAVLSWRWTQSRASRCRKLKK